MGSIFRNRIIMKVFVIVAIFVAILDGWMELMEVENAINSSKMSPLRDVVLMPTNKESLSTQVVNLLPSQTGWMENPMIQPERKIVSLSTVQSNTSGWI